MAEPELSDPAFVILAILAEGECHGYALQKKVHDRGFRFWTDLGRSSIYSGLAKLEGMKLVASRLESGGGPARKVLRITARGRRQLRADAIRRLARPGHPRNEIDLGIYALPYLGEDGLAALDESLSYLREREGFLGERLSFCREREMTLPALAFERPLRALQAEIGWLESVRDALARGELTLQVEDWQAYEYLEPPDPDA